MHEIFSTLNYRKRSIDNVFIPKQLIDCLFDYPEFLGKSSSILRNGQSLQGHRVAVIGAGVAGLISTLELLRAGASVDLYEGSNRLGGRIYSIYPKSQADDLSIFELGPMRFPIAERTLFYYLNQCNLKAEGDFPDPGVKNVFTQLYFENTLINWFPPKDGEETSLPDSALFKKLGMILIKCY